MGRSALASWILLPVTPLAIACSYVPAPIRPSLPGLPEHVARAERFLGGGAPLGRVTEAIVVVVLDGARWQDVLVGTDASFGSWRGPSDLVSGAVLMPNLHAMIMRGAVVGSPGGGAPMRASGPDFISLPGYTEIFSGRTPVRCADNDCPATEDATLVDEVSAHGGLAAVFASWAPIARAASRSPEGMVVSTGEPETARFRADRQTATEALDYLTRRRPQFLFLGLGEPDELAHQGDYAGYLDTLRQADVVLGELEVTLAAMGERGRRTSVFVTCDHGRGTDFRHHGRGWPESSRVWLVAAGGAIPARGVVQSRAPQRLRDIAPTIRVLLGLPADGAAEAGAPIAELIAPP